MTSRLVALDIDGTLVDLRTERRDRAGASTPCGARRDAGAHVVLSTGRSVFGVVRILDLLGLRATVSAWPATAP